MNNSHDDILAQYQLQFIEILQENETKRVELVEEPKGTKLVLKFCKTSCPLLQLEIAFLQLTAKTKYEYLELPELIAHGPNFMLMSYVKREYQTRETVLSKNWSEQEINTLCGGIREFQNVNLAIAPFTLRQRIMGAAYPALKLIMVMPHCLRRKIILWDAIAKIIVLDLKYFAQSFDYTNVTTHYDLTTYNCAIAESGKLSILDFEFGYFRGDSLFDICYFITIPPQSMNEWDFQSRALFHFIKREINPAVQLRVRLILLVCCLVRALHFSDGSAEHDAYLESIALILNDARFIKWWQSNSRLTL